MIDLTDIVPGADIERELNVPTPPLISISPLKPLWDACELLIRTHARRLPLLDIQPTGEEVILSVLTQYRALKAISTNVGPSLDLDLLIYLLTPITPR